MKATGMIRRMDELGRVVIPKEIRRSMHLREGEELEIFAEDDGLFLKKYSAMSSLEGSADDYVRVVEQMVGNTVYVADTESLLVGVGKYARTEEDNPLSSAVLAVMEGRKSCSLGRGTLARGGREYAHVVVAPVVVHGDLFGAVLVGGDSPLDARVQSVAETAARLLAKEIGD